MLNLYTLVRDDLRPADKSVQSTHAVADFAAAYTHTFRQWQTGSNTLIVLEVPGGERGLCRWYDILIDGGYKVSMFTEPDGRMTTTGRYIKQACTALTVEPNWTLQNILFKDLPLASFEPPKKQRFRRLRGLSWYG